VCERDRDKQSAPLNIVARSGGPSSKYTRRSAVANRVWDTARDLPDVSLFSSDGQNGSFSSLANQIWTFPGDTGCNLTNFSS